MGKASRRQRGTDTTSRQSATAQPAPFERRPFEGLAGETDWVALREILPAATAVVTVRPEHVPEGAPSEVTVATVLPLAWPGLHRADGAVLIGTQSGNASGDASRDLAGQLLAATRRRAGHPVSRPPQATADSPRLQDVLDRRRARSRSPCTRASTSGSAARSSRPRAPSRSSAPTPPSSPPSRLTALPSAYWCRIGERTHIRLVLPDDEDAATDALARLHAAGDDALGDDTRLLGAFRACGLLVPVWDLDPELEAADYEDELAAWGTRYAAALAVRRLAHRRRAPGPLRPAQPPGHPALIELRWPRRVGRRRPVQGRGRAHRRDRRGRGAPCPQVDLVVVVDDGSRPTAPPTPPGPPAPTSCAHARNRGKAAAMRPARAGCASSSGRMPSPTRAAAGPPRLLFVDGDLEDDRHQPRRAHRRRCSTARPT